MVFYTETQGIIINSIVSVFGIVSIAVFIFLANNKDKFSLNLILKAFGYIFLVQLISFVLAVLLDILIALLMDALGLSLSWYTSKWILFGLYFCPVFFVLGIGQSVILHFNFMREKELPAKLTTQMMMHSHSLILIVLLLIMTGLNIRSSFIIMISVFFYIISVIINFVIDRFYKHGKNFI